MPSVEENFLAWEEGARWGDGESGELWSTAWGGAASQWAACVHPRLRHLLPTGMVLEIAPGHGRWTQFLIPRCQRLVGVDLSPSCVAACQRRFGHLPNVAFHVNDGRSLAAVPDRIVDLAFSFDSLVHVERDVLADYVRGLAMKLADDGVAFIHHSNLGHYPRHRRLVDRMPPALRERLEARGFVDPLHWRAPTVDAAWFASTCAESGLQCASQELVNWGSRRLIDCISVVVRADGPRVAPTRVVENPWFMADAQSARVVAELYDDGIRQAGT